MNGDTRAHTTRAASAFAELAGSPGSRQALLDVRKFGKLASELAAVWRALASAAAAGVGLTLVETAQRGAAAAQLRVRGTEQPSAGLSG